MNDHLKSFVNHSAYSAIKNQLIKPNVSYCVQENEMHYNPITWADRYLTFVPLEDSTFQMTKNAVSYSLDGGTTWETLAANTATPTVTAGSKIIWKGELTPAYEGFGTFSSSGRFDAKGNPMSLLYGDNFIGKTDISDKGNYTFMYLFYNNTNLINANELSLPATELSAACYDYMFLYCTNLITAPELPATTLAQSCYYGMFSNCSSLTIAPELPATTIARSCYREMFKNCSSLTLAPELLAINSIDDNSDWQKEFIYQQMFEGCTNLIQGPSVLPITLVSRSCYSKMFKDCTNLERAPEILATNNPDSSYSEMFSGCSKVNRIKHMLSYYWNQGFYNWVNGVSPTGTFIKSSSMTNDWDIGTNGIPSGWTVETASE